MLKILKYLNKSAQKNKNKNITDIKPKIKMFK